MVLGPVMPFDAVALYRKYDAEVYELCRRLQPQYHLMQDRGEVSAFSDIEGEIVYMLLRERQPDVVFEISPASGWSTNYILGALTANRRGVVHSFEIRDSVRGRPAEAHIRANQHPDWDQSRLVLHIGNATTLAPEVPGPIDFLLLDSCHDDWFADWYIRDLLPRLQGPAFVQDIAFVDGLEASSEARRLWTWLEGEQLSTTLIGAVEDDPQVNAIRARYAERRSEWSNAVLFFLPPDGRACLPALRVSPEDRLAEAEAALAVGNRDAAAPLLNVAVGELLRNNRRGTRYRSFARAANAFRNLGEPGEARRCLQRAVGITVERDLRDRSKGLAELAVALARQRAWRLLLQVMAVVAIEPKTWHDMAWQLGLASRRRLRKGGRP